MSFLEVDLLKISIKNKNKKSKENFTYTLELSAFLKSKPQTFIFAKSVSQEFLF
jgi:hypothetical protein